MRVGLIGHGYWGKILESKLSKYFEIEFIATSNTDYNTQLDFIDWVFVATPYETHYDIVMNCLERGVNVFCEKPFNLDPVKSKELFDLAEQKGLNLYIDNIFLDREEIISIKKVLLNINSIKFVWYKPNTSKCGIINGLLYHDIYLMMYLMGEYDGLIRINSHKISDTSFHMNFDYNNVNVTIEYDVNNITKNKTISINNNININLNNPINDPLDEIINKISNGVELPYQYNKLLTIGCEEKVKQIIEKI